MKDDADETQLEQPPESGGAPESEQRLFQIHMTRTHTNHTHATHTRHPHETRVHMQPHTHDTHTQGTQAQT